MNTVLHKLLLLLVILAPLPLGSNREWGRDWVYPATGVAVDLLRENPVG